MDVRFLLESLYNAGVKAADPREATAGAVASMHLERAPGIIALGKAAERMTAGALEALDERRADVTGLVISHMIEQPGTARLPHMKSDHPIPDRMLAGEALEGVVERLRACSDVLVLLSGGASSLAAAPVRGVSPDELRGLFGELLRSGHDINTINAVRRRVLRWGGGRLAQALHPARVHCLIVSDVMGNELAAIGSGPCVRDPTLAEDITERLEIPAAAIAPSIWRLLIGAGPASPLPGRDADEVRVLLDNSTAVQGSVRAAKAAGYRVVSGIEMQGDAATFGAVFAAHLLRLRTESLGSPAPAICVSGGETVVTLGDHTGRGGRCQELALAFARAAAAAEVRSAMALLAAGTDGRDGPTDAAGAIVDGDTWRAIAESGRSPDRDLATHDAYAALNSAGALLPERGTDTNVNDLAIGVIR